MARKTDFGRTWWGNAWLEALHRIDIDTNRLPRGRSYARRGTVSEITVKAGRVTARVQGTRSHPYKVSIRFTPFSRKDKQAIAEVIAGSPTLALRLSLGSLPEPLLSALEDSGIHLFPRGWNELEAACSCPDWANPCKHLAAVYYVLANEIDKDPFLVFELKGMKAGELAAAAGMVRAHGEGEEGVPEIAADPFVPPEEAGAADPETDCEGPDLSLARTDPASLLALLSPRPLFREKGDFKEDLLQAYACVAEGVDTTGIIEDLPWLRNVDLRLTVDGSGRPEPSFFVFNDPPRKGTGLLKERLREALPAGTVIKDVRLRVPVVINGAASTATRDGQLVRAEDLLPLLMSLSPETAVREYHSRPLRFFVLATAVAMAMAGASAMLPEVVPGKGDDFHVRFRPLWQEGRASAVREALRTALPPRAVFRTPGEELLSPDGIDLLLSHMLTWMVWNFCSGRPWAHGDKISQAFFRGRLYRAGRFEEKQTARSVANWLAHLSAVSRELAPEVRIETAGGGSFSLFLDVVDRSDPLSPRLTWSEVCRAEGTVFGRPAVRVRAELGRQAALASEYLPQLAEILDSRGETVPAIDASGMAGVLTGTSSTLGLMGIRMALPRELRELAKPRLALRADLKKGTAGSVTYLSLPSLLEFSWRVAIGDHQVTAAEFRKLAKRAGGVVEFRGQYLMLSPEEARSILTRLSGPPPSPNTMEVVQWAMLGEREGVTFRPGAALKRVLKSIGQAADIDMPESLEAELRPYQERGVQWLYANLTRGFGACLADDMGLGKTVQALALLLKLKEEGKLKGAVLVVCPTTIVGNWQKECERFAPTLETLVYYGADRRLSVKGKDLVITTYGVLRRDLEKFRARKWLAVIIDEAQNIKNPQTDQARAVKALQPGLRLALSGTPVENRLLELWSIFDFLNPGYLGGVTDFQKRFAVPIERYRNHEQAERLSMAISPFVLRRLKSDRSIIADLPDKVITDEYCRLTPQQASLYQTVLEEIMAEIESSEGIERRGLVLKLILSLKQICNHPALYTKRGSVTPSASGKAERLLELVERLLEAGEKALIFTQYREMGGLLQELIERELGERSLFFHGGVTRPKRDRMVQAFQEDSDERLMVVSLKAGGVGLNLTAATNVIHYDLWWNPAVEDQATDRAYRIGQTRNVMVHRLLCLGTFEERIDAMIKSKRELADITVKAGETWITEMGNEELRGIFNLGGTL